MTEKSPEAIRLIYKAKNLEDSKKISDYSKSSDQVIFIVNE